MHLSTQAQDNIWTVKVEEPRIDAEAALSFKEGMRRVCEGAPPVIVLDLRSVEFIDSSGLGALVGTMKVLTPDHELRLAGMTPPVRKVFELTRMDTVFALFETPEEAVAWPGA